MNNKIKIILLVIIPLFYFGKLSAQNNHIDSLQIDNIDFLYLDAKMRLSYEDSQEKFKAKVRLRMRQDSLIWVSITKTSVEGIRILIKTDSIFLLNRIDKTFQILTFEDLSKKLNIDLNFQLLQAILVGNYFLEEQPINESEETNESWILKQPYARLDVENHILKSNQKLQNLTLKGQVSESTLDLKYENFNDFEVGTFPLLLKMILKYTNTQTLQNQVTNVSLEYQSVIFLEEPLRFPFNVSDNYERK